MNKARPAMPLFEEESRSLFHCLGRGLAEMSPRTVQSMYHFHVWIQFNFAHVINSIPEVWRFQMMIISPCCVLFLFFLSYLFNIPNEKCRFFRKSINWLLFKHTFVGSWNPGKHRTPTFKWIIYLRFFFNLSINIK